MKKILISTSKLTKTEYEEAVAAAGGIAMACYLPDKLKAAKMLLANFCELLAQKYDGLILSGGGDVNPRIYSEEMKGSRRVDDERDTIEFGLIESFMKLGKPIMGICRGFQVMNIALGGTLYQDNGDEYNKYHTSDNGTYKIHSTYTKPSILQTLYGENFTVNSHHHQSLKKIADDLAPIQYSKDKQCVEAAVHKTYPYIGVQWHPERLCKPNEKDRDCVDGLLLFKYFLSQIKN